MATLSNVTFRQSRFIRLQAFVGCLTLISSLTSTQLQALDEIPAPLSAAVDYYDINHPVIGRQGMVVSQKRIASEIGANILKQGGNAVDAAVAVGFALSVVLPRAGNLGGGGFMLIHLAKDNKTLAIDYREIAPEQADKNMFIGEHGKVKSNDALLSLKASGVPGTVAGLHYALTNYGTMQWQDVIKPAENLARQGLVVDDDMHRLILKEYAEITIDKETCRVFFKKNCQPYAVGETIPLTDLADSLAYIANTGKEGFYQGDIAKKIVKKMADGGGYITAKDLANYHVEEVTPLKGTYNEFEILTMPPPSSGGVHIIQLLNIMQQLDFENVKQGSAAHIHLQTEAFKRAYADRSTFLGDPDFVTVPEAGLTSKAYAKSISKGISAGKITPSSKIKAGAASAYESPDTTHFSVMDSEGNVVSNTYTLNHYFGSGFTVDGTGILLNNTMDDFTLKTGTANSYGLIGGEANSIAAKKRPLSSMTPTIVLKNGQPYIATGTPGGSKIITAVFQQLFNVLHYQMNIAEATIAPRVHHQWQPDILYYERNLPADTLAILKAKGYQLEMSSSLGSLQSIMKHNGLYLGVADPRRPGATAVAVDQVLK